MQRTHRRQLNTAERSASRIDSSNRLRGGSQTLTRCPDCGTPIEGTTATGPGEHEFVPCGHATPQTLTTARASREPIADGGLPDDWAAVDATRPSNLPKHITPAMLAEAVVSAETLFDVTRTVRAGRTPVRRALDRLGLDGSLGSFDARTVTKDGLAGGDA